MRPDKFRRTFDVRFWGGVQKLQQSDCWPWIRARCNNGYGKIKLHGKFLSAHRVAFELAHGTIPAGKVVCHTCDNRFCCNPAHLVAMTQSENILDAFRKGRMTRAQGGRPKCA